MSNAINAISKSVINKRKVQKAIYRVAQKCKPLLNDKKIVLNRIKACQ